MRTESTQCVVVGGGPGGLMAGLILSRAGIRVIVLEKHADFLRDFRGDTVHPSTLTLLDELGLGGAFDKIPHTELTFAGFPTEDSGMMKLADFSRLKVAPIPTSRWRRSGISSTCSPRPARRNRPSTCAGVPSAPTCCARESGSSVSGTPIPTGRASSAPTW